MVTILARSSLRSLRRLTPSTGGGSHSPVPPSPTVRPSRPRHPYLHARELRTTPSCQQSAFSPTTTTVITPHLNSPSLLSFKTVRTFVNDLAKLSKHRLSALVAFTASAGYICRYEQHPATSAAENEAHTNDKPPAPQNFYRTLASTTIGTFLTAASANTLNQLYERTSDASMSRTRARPLPSGRVSPRVAVAYALFSGLSGISLLLHDTNSVAASLAAANLVLYSAVYTPLKAFSTANTTVGAIVGALPPLIGWTAASDGKLFDNMREAGAAPWAALLFLWQIPHFHALAVALRTDYAAAGLRMLAVSHPVANARWAYAAALALVPLGAAFHWAGVASEAFVWQSALLSLWMARAAKPLLENPLSVPAARRLFRASIVHLPVCMMLLLLNRTEYAPMTNDAQVEARQESHVQAANESREVQIYYPWEVIAPFPFLPVPRGPPAIVLDANE